jgi:hypothetical protein
LDQVLVFGEGEYRDLIAKGKLGTVVAAEPGDGLK